jgi:hypothetical protein
MLSTSAARWMLPSSAMATSSSSWRVLSRARMNQWVTAAEPGAI